MSRARRAGRCRCHRRRRLGQPSRRATLRRDRIRRRGRQRQPGPSRRVADRLKRLYRFRSPTCSTWFNSSSSRHVGVRRGAEGRRFPSGEPAKVYALPTPARTTCRTRPPTRHDPTRRAFLHDTRTSHDRPPNARHSAQPELTRPTRTGPDPPPNTDDHQAWALDRSAGADSALRGTTAGCDGRTTRHTIMPLSRSDRVSCA